MKPVFARAHPTPSQAAITCVSTALTALLCGGLMAAAALAPAPGAALLLIVAACILVPMLTAWDAAPSVAVLHGHLKSRRLALVTFRQELSALPETRHPLGL